MFVAILEGITIAMLFVIMMYVYDKNNSSKLYKVFFFLVSALLIEAIGMFAQVLMHKLIDIKPVYFEYFAQIGAQFAPTLFLMFALLYNNYKFNIKKINWLFVIDGIMLIMLWTNDWHGLFYTQYSMDNWLLQKGTIWAIFIIYYYLQLFAGAEILIYATYRKSGFFSVQTLFILMGYMFPLVLTALSVTGVIVVPRYFQVVPYMGSVLCIAIAIVKLRALDIIPVAQDTIMDTMSDAFVIVALDGTFTDMNKIFIEKFQYPMQLRKNANLIDVIKNSGIGDLKRIQELISKAEKERATIIEEIHMQKGDYDRYFQLEVSPIKEKKGPELIATLLLFRDITAEKREVEVLIKNESMAILGELAGGVAHDINTPITAISSGLLMLDSKIKDPDQKMLISSMQNSADKITNLVNGLRNQIRNLGTGEDVDINLAEFMQELRAILYSECIKNNIRMNINADETVWINGKISRLTQVISSIITNAIKAYDGKGGQIDIEVKKIKNGNEVYISIEDYAGGIDKRIRPYIFKSLVVTKHNPSVGVGLYIANSIIKSTFKGDINFTCKEGIGTKFEIILPINAKKKIIKKETVK